MSVVVTDYTTPAFHRILSAIERGTLVDLFETFSETRARERLHSLLSDLDAFFAEHPVCAYFLRLSTLSPKDAFYDESKSLREQLQVLRVTNGMRCIEVLCHSRRARIDLDFEMAEEAIELLPWIDLDHASETRLFVRNRRVVAASQYYADEPYTANMKFLREAIKLVEAHPALKTLPDVAADVGTDAKGNLVLIEMNTLDENLDYCLFEDLEGLRSVWCTTAGEYELPLNT